MSPRNSHVVTGVACSLSQRAHCVHLACLPAITRGRRVSLSCCSCAILGCRQNPAFSAFQCVLKTSDCPGIRHAFSAQLELLRHLAFHLPPEQLLGFQPLQCAKAVAGLPRLYRVSQSNKSPCNTCPLCQLCFSRKQD